MNRTQHKQFALSRGVSEATYDSMNENPLPRTGRPSVSDDEGPSLVIRVRVGAERAAKFQRLGGAEWLRKMIDKARE